MQGEFIYECDGSVTPLTPLHEKILDEYMEKLANYYRILYSSEYTTKTNDNKINSDPTSVLKEPDYPQLCKICSDDST